MGFRGSCFWDLSMIKVCCRGLGMLTLHTIHMQKVFSILNMDALT